MGTLAQLTTIALNENLEGWWYPVWTFKLLPYVAAGYGGTQNLSICPQPALRGPANGANPYVYPDFAMIDSFGGAGVPVGRNLRLVMENKRTASLGQIIQAQLDCEFYATYAISAFNFPANPISFVATAGRLWTWRQAAQDGGGVWAWAVVWTWGGNEVAPFQGVGAPLNI